MACIELRYPHTIPVYLPCATRSALIAPNSGEELLQSGPQQPKFSPPGPCLLHSNLQNAPIDFEILGPYPTYPALEEVQPRDQSHSPHYITTQDANTLPKPITRNPRRTATYPKARTQYARDHKFRRSYTNGVVNSSKADQIIETACDPRSEIVPTRKPHLRKRSTFVIDEEIKSQLDARADTPHISEVIPGEDVSAPEIAIGSRYVSHDMLPMMRITLLTSITSVPGGTANAKAKSYEL